MGKEGGGKESTGVEYDSGGLYILFTPWDKPEKEEFLNFFQKVCLPLLLFSSLCHREPGSERLSNSISPRE